CHSPLPMPIAAAIGRPGECGWEGPAGRAAGAAAPGPVRATRMFMRIPREPPEQPLLACYGREFGRMCELLHTRAQNPATALSRGDVETIRERFRATAV